jgi:hypothetical protein
MARVAAPVAILGLLTLASVASPQSPPPSPAPSPAAEMPRNVKVLPRDWTRAQVVDRVMKKWTADLGVRCQYCHVGEEALPMKQWDFASDARPTKQRAREMYLMLDEVNRRLGAMPALHDQAAAPLATCFTCHRGQPRPQRIDDVFAATLGARGLDAAIAEYRELRDANLASGGYDFSVKPLVRIARARLEANDAAGADQVMQLALGLGFDTLSTRSTLAEIAVAQGDRAKARAHLEKALSLAKNPAEREFVQDAMKALDTP